MASASGLYRQLVAAEVIPAHERGWAELGPWLKEHLAAGDERVRPFWHQALVGLAHGIINLHLLAVYLVDQRHDRKSIAPPSGWPPCRFFDGRDQISRENSHRPHV